MKYIVQTKYDDDKIGLSLMTAAQIVEAESMSDCSGVEMKVWENGEFGTIIPLKIHGTWHMKDPKDSLYIKATRPDGSIAFDGWGIDH